MEIGSRISVEVPIRDSGPGCPGNAVRQILAYLTINSREGEGSQGNKQNLDQTIVNGGNAEWNVPGSAKTIKMDLGKSVTNLTAEELFRFIMSDHRYLKMDSGNGGDSNNSVPNAAEIQKFFLETIDRISFKPIKDAETRRNSPYGASPRKPESSNIESMHDKLDLTKLGVRDAETIQIAPETITWDEFEKRRKEKEIWTTECRAVLGKMQHNTLIKHALDLLEECWKRYLSTPIDAVKEQNTDSSHELNLTDDVTEMLADRSRYVWQIIDEMPPRNLSLPF